MNQREHLEHKSKVNPANDKSELVQKIYFPAVGSWFQKRLVHVRNELKKEMLTKLARLTKDH
jgi:hypothetical protein